MSCRTAKNNAEKESSVSRLLAFHGGTDDDVYADASPAKNDGSLNTYFPSVIHARKRGIGGTGIFEGIQVKSLASRVTCVRLPWHITRTLAQINVHGNSLTNRGGNRKAR